MSETETRQSKNAVDSEMRPSKSGLETRLETRLETKTKSQFLFLSDSIYGSTIQRRLTSVTLTNISKHSSLDFLFLSRSFHSFLKSLDVKSPPSPSV